MRKSIHLIGFMGSGKSTVGPLLSVQVNLPFYDLDELIEKQKEMTISEIFESKGESFFRKLESKILVQSFQLAPYVMALGGGAFSSNYNRKSLIKQGVIIWLKAPFNLIEERCRMAIHRPLARNTKKLETLFRLREAYYRLADIYVNVQGKSPEQICTEIQDKLDTCF